MEIDPRLNGIHSLAEALKAFEGFHNNPEDIYAIKDSILRTHHALETLFKHILYLISPTLLIKNETKVEKIIKEGYYPWFREEIATPLDKLETIGLIEAIDRLKNLGILQGLDEREFEAFKGAVDELRKYRNKIQHFALKVDPDRIGRVLGIVLPRAIEVLEQTYNYIYSLALTKGKYFEFPIRAVSEAGGGVYNDLNKLLPKAQKIMSLLRYNYDALVSDAIQFFKQRIFQGQSVSLNITYHGKVGPPPYMPNLSVNGFVNLNIDELRMSIIEAPYNLRYEANIEIGPPKLISKSKLPSHGISKSYIRFDAHIYAYKAQGILNLPDAEEKIEVLRDLHILIKANLNYEAKAIVDNWHYDCIEPLKVNGELYIQIMFTPRGYESKEVKLSGLYKAKLDQKNAPFRLHAFLNPDGTIKDGPMNLEWNINTSGDLTFE